MNSALLNYTNPHRSLPTQKALASFLAKRGNAGMAVPFQIPRMQLGGLPAPSQRASLKCPYSLLCHLDVEPLYLR